MSKSLKERNQTQLITFVLANAIGLGILLQGLKEVLFLLDSVSKGNIAVIFRLVAIPAGLAVLIGILGWAVPRRWKETVIFWRTDKNCLPSSRAFSVIALNDPRIDRRRLAKKHGPLPTAPDQQTVLWYSLYRKNADNGAVEDAHCAYLRYREMTAFAVSIMTIFLVASGVVHPSSRTILIGATVIAAEYLLLLVAARNAAGHFVSNVLAIESAAE
ncbi:MAG: hypothetical protein ACLPVW_10230 [Terriglobales bacterium]